MSIALTTFVVGLVSGFVPFVSIEAYLAGVSALAPAATLGAVVAAATLGQMSGKCVLFLAGRGLLRLPLRHDAQRGLGRMRGFLEGGGARALALVFVSALAGVPPFYVVTVAAGALGISFPRFCAVGALGRLLRFAVIFLLPRAF